MQETDWTVSITRMDGSLIERVDCKRAVFDAIDRHVGCVNYDDAIISLNLGIWLVGIVTIIFASLMMLLLLSHALGRTNFVPIVVRPNLVVLA